MSPEAPDDRSGIDAETAYFKLRSAHQALDIRKNPVLHIEGSGLPDQMDSFTELLQVDELWANAEVDIRERYHYLWEEIEEHVVEQKGWDALVDRETLTYQMLVAYNYGSRLANETLIHLTHADSDDPNEFGNWARVALRNQELPHADNHTRAVEAIQKMNAILVGADVYDPSLTLVVAAAMKPIFHDIMQNLWEQQKEMHPNDEMLKKLDPKDDHKEAAAFLVHVLKPVIQQAGHLSDRLTEELVRVLSAGIAVHDQLDDFQFRLSGKEKVSAAGLDDEALYKHYKDGTVDQMSLSGLDRYRILMMQQEAIVKKKGWTDGSIFGNYGLGVSFEAAHGDRIRQTIDPGSQQTEGPIEVDRDLMVAWDSMFNLTDIWEMIIPGEYAVLRKEKVYRSTIRPLISPNGDIEVAFSPTPLDNYDLSSWCRAMYEYRSNVAVLKKSPFAKNELFMEFLGNTILYNLLQGQKLYRALVKGEEGLKEFDRIQNERMRMATRKAMNKIGVPKEEAQAVMMQISGMDFEQIFDAAISKLTEKRYGAQGIEYATRLALRYKAMQKEFDRVRANMRKKKRPDGTPSEGRAHTYTDEEIHKMEENFSQAWMLICNELGIADADEQKIIRFQMETLPAHQVADIYSMLPNPGYPDSLGKLSDAKTINGLPDQIRVRLQGSPFEPSEENA